MSDAPDEIWIKANRDYVSVWARPIFTDPFDPRGIEYIRSDTIPSPDALIRAALDAAAEVSKGDGEGEWFNPTQAIRALKTNPEALAAIKAKAEGRG